MRAVSFSLLRALLSGAVIVLLLLTAAGCKSSHSSVRRGSSASTHRPERPAMVVDYSREVTDPLARALISAAQEWIGTRYLYGGDTREGTDCSALVMNVYQEVCGMKIPRSTRQQVRYCTKVARNSMQPGDLVFFGSGDTDDSVSHVGLYIGQGKMIHASSSKGVIVSGFDSGYWCQRYFTGARIDGAPRAFAMRTGGAPARQEEVPVPSPESIQPEAPLIAAATVAPASSVASSPVAPGSSRETAPAAPAIEVEDGPAVSTIDLLDLIINQKVDSIYANGFND